MDLDRAYNNSFYYQVDDWDCPDCQSGNLNNIKFETRSSLKKSIFHKIDSLVDFYLKGINYLKCSQCEKTVVVAAGFHSDKEDIVTKEITNLSF